MQIRVGARLRSAVDTTEVVIIEADRDDAVLTCGGAPMVPLDGPPSTGAPAPGHDAGTELGKRYTDVDSSLEILCTRSGSGALCVDGGPMQLKKGSERVNEELPTGDRSVATARRDALFDLSGRSILVTGGTRGLGRAMAHGFAAWGADVLVSSRDEESCRRVAEELGEYGHRADWINCNVGHWDQVERLADEALTRFGSIDVLVNNAGMSPLYPNPESVSEALFDKTISVNLKGPFRLSALLGARMVENGKGSIINIGSTGSIRPTRGIIPYAAAKAGLTAMTIGFADAYGPNVRVNAILPGRFRTDVTTGWSEEMLSGARSRLARIGDPPEIVGAALYLASDASSYTTGSVLVLDGGSY